MRNDSCSYFRRVSNLTLRSPLLRITLLVVTLTATSSLSSCAFINRHYGESCNSHAYVRTVLSDYISNRFHRDSPVRLAVIPFSVPANISSVNSERQGLGNELAWKTQAYLLGREATPIVEVLNREDWPGKKDEFRTGNFGAIALAREAGYDLVLVGYLDSMRSLEEATLHTKLIEVESGITVWYGTTRAVTYRRDANEAVDFFGIQDRRPDMIATSALADKLAKCVAEEITKEEELD